LKGEWTIETEETSEGILDRIIFFLLAPLIFLVIVESVAQAVVTATQHMEKIPRERPIWLRRHAIRGRMVRSRGLGL